MTNSNQGPGSSTECSSRGPARALRARLKLRASRARSLYGPIMHRAATALTDQCFPIGDRNQATCRKRTLRAVNRRAMPLPPDEIHALQCDLIWMRRQLARRLPGHSTLTETTPWTPPPDLQ